MEPEKIDKLFRDKLAGLPAAPSPDAWMRLQQKMEPPKKAATRWIYYAAASVVILLISGILYFKNGADPAGPAVATTPVLTQPATPLPADHLNPGNNPEQNPENNPEQNPEPERLVAQARVPETKTGKSKALPVKGRRPKALTQPNAGLPASAPTLASASSPFPVVAPVAETAAQSQAPAAPAFNVIEVVVTRGPEADIDVEMSFRENLNRQGNRLKNIYQQARNLKNGEPVELAALGVDKGKIKEETKELKQKLSNVISL